MRRIMMFANVVQPSIISLFSSTGNRPLQLFSSHVDPSPALRSDSFIHLLNDTSSSDPPPPHPAVLVRDTSKSAHEADDGEDKGRSETDDRTLCQTVLHIQSPTLRTTYIRCPTHRSSSVSDDKGADAELGLTLPWLHLQVRRLGERDWAFEVGIADRARRNGIIRFSTFQKEAAVSIRHDPPLLHVPLRFPTALPGRLTSWSTISVDLGSMIHQFRAISVAQRTPNERLGPGEDEDEAPHHHSKREGTGSNAPLPSGGFGRITYVKVFANCRLRRIWFTEDRRATLPWEFELYAASQH